MTTYPHSARLHLPHINPWLVAVAGLGAALIGLGAWVLVDRYAGGTSATQDATTLIDGFKPSGGAGDSGALAAVLTSDVVMTSEGTVISGAQSLVGAAVMASAAGLRVERIAPVVVHGDFATTFLRATEAASEKGTLTCRSLLTAHAAAHNAANWPSPIRARMRMTCSGSIGGTEEAASHAAAT